MSNKHLLRLKLGSGYKKQLAVPRVTYGPYLNPNDIGRLWVDFASVGINVRDNPKLVTNKTKCENCKSIAVSSQNFACGNPINNGLAKNSKKANYLCSPIIEVEQTSHEYFKEKASEHPLYAKLFSGYFFNSAKVDLSYCDSTQNLKADSYIHKEVARPFEFWHLATTPEELIFMFEVLQVEIPKVSRKALLSLILQYAVTFFSPSILALYLKLKIFNKPIKAFHIDYLHTLVCSSPFGVCYGIETIPAKGGCGEVRFHSGYLEFNRIFNYEMCKAIRSCTYNPFLRKE